MEMLTPKPSTGGHYHAKRRMRKGLKPLRYHAVSSLLQTRKQLRAEPLITYSSSSHVPSVPSLSLRTTSPSTDKTTRVTEWNLMPRLLQCTIPILKLLLGTERHKERPNPIHHRNGSRLHRVLLGVDRRRPMWSRLRCPIQRRKSPQKELCSRSSSRRFQSSISLANSKAATRVL